MGRRRTDRVKVERGDFQTPPALAADVCAVLAREGIAPRSIVEPTCGTGTLLAAALGAFPGATAIGADVNAGYVACAREVAPGARIERWSFFEADWPGVLAKLSAPLLLIGNPPWVTNSDLGAMRSTNLPAKRNTAGRAGLDALTGKSNFDISEWMISNLLAWLDGRDATLAMLCKTAVARKVLASAWRSGVRIEHAAMYRIDAAEHFGAAVDACLLVCRLGTTCRLECASFESLHAPRATATLGYRGDALVADVALYDRHRDLVGASPHTWRSGIKHDCAALMELRRCGTKYENAAGERVDLEPAYLFPMLKSSDLARGDAPTRYMLVPQRRIGEDTRAIAELAPRTWRYLERHRVRFAARRSSIYRGKPPFSIFGVGDYTFTPWKVAISGLYKQLAFRVIGPHDGKPVVFDDTCYFVACAAEREARQLAALLASAPAQELYRAFIFWDAKRPITTELLGRLDLARLDAESHLRRSDCSGESSFSLARDRRTLGA